MRVQVVAPDSTWPASYIGEAMRLRDTLGSNVLEVHHIGSTAILGIFAKPIIDILLVVQDLQLLDDSTPALGKLGYEGLGEFGIPGRRYFRKNSPDGSRTHQIHSFLLGSVDAERHLAFRDYMNAHPAAAQEYSSLKKSLAAAHPDAIDAYMDGKDCFIKAHELKALAWWRKVENSAQQSSEPTRP
ncbi:MAG TPA: GrpB family protein [Steroidobacteraceae bacterium]